MLDNPGAVLMFFRDNSFNGTGTYSTTEVIVHEHIHSSGVGIHPWPFSIGPTYGHDLDGYKHFRSILEACGKPEE